MRVCDPGRHVCMVNSGRVCEQVGLRFGTGTGTGTYLEPRDRCLPVEVGAKIDTKNLEVGAYRMAAAAEFTAKAVSVTVKCRININIGITETVSRRPLGLLPVVPAARGACHNRKAKPGQCLMFTKTLTIKSIDSRAQPPPERAVPVPGSSSTRTVVQVLARPSKYARRLQAQLSSAAALPVIQTQSLSLFLGLHVVGLLFNLGLVRDGLVQQCRIIGHAVALWSICRRNHLCHSHG